MEEEVVKVKSPLNDGLKSVDLVTMRVVTKDVELVSKEDLIKAFPDIEVKKNGQKYIPQS